MYSCLIYDWDCIMNILKKEDYKVLEESQAPYFKKIYEIHQKNNIRSLPVIPFLHSINKKKIQAINENEFLSLINRFNLNQKTFQLCRENKK